ncbi:hypothetical protein ACUXCC_004211 [Cytobacillus horneckiae]|uniref:Uncharacterized protein n=1 Tax=Cytobacillus horneckiae TaxID=549687 RepID=A0A2N0ZHY1_9BACI|nr:hypothetical protein [Cytobacillus horneckiae]MBN6886899.1 hypothetical protein [Cytobacillus horneckiae]MCM3177632.1 hypothetical protein [Cytobacillus horneckiae]MEC1157937.1 hypothetical protein [Cytobacillus horneckiae]MED2937138.1 hypothetical protein [Cytobacillus horneckiae]PKG29122.1 hypothetical protein CWS20_10180 [Cytobacillus horneckiae]
MKLMADNSFFEIVYDQQQFNYLEFIRIDYICDIVYMTFKNIFTSEMYTFEKEKISNLTKIINNFPGFLANH